MKIPITINYIRNLSVPERAKTFLEIYKSWKTEESLNTDHIVEGYLLEWIGDNPADDPWARDVAIAALEWISEGKTEKDKYVFCKKCCMNERKGIFNWSIRDYDTSDMVEFIEKLEHIDTINAALKFQKRIAVQTFLDILNKLKKL